MNQSVLILCLIVVSTTSLVAARRWREGPQVDPGVFVITHIRSCRNGAGYCILGIKCSVDTDFVDDDSGGDCNSLSAAFNPKATFVCCRENPENFDTTEQDALNAIILEEFTGQNTTTTTTTPSTTEAPQTQTSIVTQIVTEIQTEFVTKVDEVTEIYTEIVTETIDQENKNNNTSVDSINIIDETENVIDESNKMSQEEPKESSESNEIASDYTDLEELLLG